MNDSRVDLLSFKRKGKVAGVVTELFKLPLIQQDENILQKHVLPNVDQGTMRKFNKLISLLYFLSPYIFALFFMISAAYINSLSQIFVQYLMTSRDKSTLAKKVNIFNSIQNYTQSQNLSSSIENDLLKLASGFLLDHSDHYAGTDSMKYCTPSNCTIEGNLLYDIGFAVIPEIVDREGTRVADVYLNTMIGITVVVALFHWDTFMRIFRRYLIVHGTLFTIRGLSIAMTVLPNPYKKCKPFLTQSPYVSAFLVMAGSNGTCADVFFSGHAAMMGLCAMIVTAHMTRRLTLRKIIVYIVTFIGWVIIVATRFHYTLDVFYGAVLSILVWNSYHFLIHSSFAKNHIITVWFEGRRLISDGELLKRKEDEYHANLVNDRLTTEIFENAGLDPNPYHDDDEYHSELDTPDTSFLPEKTPIGEGERSSLLDLENQ